MQTLHTISGAEIVSLKRLWRFFRNGKFVAGYDSVTNQLIRIKGIRPKFIREYMSRSSDLSQSTEARTFQREVSFH